MDNQEKKKQCIQKQCKKELDSCKKDIQELQTKIKSIFEKNKTNKKYTLAQALNDTKKIAESYQKKPQMKKLSECVSTKCSKV
jgi:hypothetical protein